MRIIKCLLLVVLAVSLCGAQVKWHYEPEWQPIGKPDKVHFDAQKVAWIDETHYIDSWVWSERDEAKQKAILKMMMEPMKIPAKKKYSICFQKITARKPDSFYSHMLMLGALNKRRTVIINVEQNSQMVPSVKIHPHLGILYVGTAARQEGYDVVLWDEVVQGHASLENLIQPGDVVGLSLVVTGIERGVELARQAKQLGASCVIAGNDSAIFRCDQLLSLQGKPIDAVFTSNSTDSVRSFYRNFDGSALEGLQIPEIKTQAGGNQHSNTKQQLVVELKGRKEQKKQGSFDNQDGFLIPQFDLFPESYWQQVWSGFRQVYGHKHRDPQTVRNALGLLAQGCTRTQGTTACTYCTIFGVADIRVPCPEYLAATMDAYNRFGITEFYNVTDSAFEMAPLVKTLEDIGASFEAMTMYARAQGIAMNPQLLERWGKLIRSRLQLNVGIDSGHNAMLTGGIGKSSVAGAGSRLDENRTAILRIRDSSAHLHYSMIFGSPGETVESCERTLEFVQWSADTLGQQLDLVESDLYWLNFGSPSSEVFYSFAYAQQLAAMAGKTITQEQWHRHFASHCNDLVVAWETERAWYEFFTRISLDAAQEYNSQVTSLMARHNGAIGGRAFFPREE